MATAGLVFLIAFSVLVIAIVVVFSVGFRAVTRKPTRGNPHPELAGRYVIAAYVFAILAAIASLVATVSGIAWIVLALTP